MMPASAVPMADFVPFLLQQTALRASLLQTSFGFAADDWDDARQDLALDCLRRLPRFDEGRGSWRGFVRGVVRHHACALASQYTRRPVICSLDAREDSEDAETCDAASSVDGESEDFRPALEMSLDVARALAGLPPDLRNLARLLSQHSLDAVRRSTGMTLSQLDRKIRCIRAALLAAGIFPGPIRSMGGLE